MMSTGTGECDVRCAAVEPRNRLWSELWRLLTPAGRRVLERGRGLALAFQDLVLADLTTAERKTLMRCLKVIEADAVLEST
jgi:hypothetical protein